MNRIKLDLSACRNFSLSEGRFRFQFCKQKKQKTHKKMIKGNLKTAVGFLLLLILWASALLLLAKL